MPMWLVFVVVEGRLACLNAAQVEEVWYLTRRVAVKQSVQLDALQEEVIVLKQAYKDGQAEVLRFTKNHALDLEKTLRQRTLLLRHHHLELRSVRQRTKKPEKSIANIENCLVTNIFWCTFLEYLKVVCSAAYSKFLENSFQDILRKLRKSLKVH